jgi:ATP-dependent DNA helicase DinG
MAEAVAAAIEEGGVLLAEAGTGTGKTLAYLIPAILSRQRALVSTGTKNLQEQIYFKDLPALQDALGVPFTATLMKGRSNYLCLHRWEMYRDGVNGNTSASGRLIDTSDRVLLPIIDAWAGTTTTGDRAELRDLPEDLPLWKEIAADAETCLGSECPRYGDCYVTLMRQRAAESDVVIVNHHLLCADASVRQSDYGEVIPSCATLVVDEAHQLEDVATQYFGVAFSNYRVDDFVRDATAVLAGRKGSPGNDKERAAARDAYGGARDASDASRTFTVRDDLSRDLSRIADRARIFFSGIPVSAESRRRYRADDLADQFEDGMMLAGALEGLEATLALRATGLPANSTEDIAAMQRRASELRGDLSFLLRASDADFVYYVETRGRGIFLRASPVDVSRIIRDSLFDRMRATVLTSATLAVDGSFEYVKSRLGLKAASEVRVPSEFDFRSQALLYLPRRLPPPKAPAFAEAAARETIEILKRSRGRAFVLFTSYAVLRTVQQFVEMALPYPILVQGTAPRSVLIDQFRSTPNAVLLATSSFWQGVDVVGEALSCVIVDKLPFASPGDPVTAARIEAINARGGDAFADYQVPLAILALQQGLGRLLRHRSDRGVLAVLDPRLKTMGYGRRFLESLPPAPVTHDLEAVGRFFG